MISSHPNNSHNHNEAGLNDPSRTHRMLRKADLAIQELIDGGGYMLPGQQQQFLQVLIDQPTLLNHARILSMRKPSQLIEKIRLGQRILHPSQSGVALTEQQRARPDVGAVEIRPVPFKAEMRLSEEVLEDNIEGPNFKGTLLSMMAERVALDMEEMILRGNRRHDHDAFLSQFDGLLAQANAHVLDHSFDDNPRTTNGLFYKMLKTLPSEFKRERSQLVAYVSTNSELDYRESLTQRAGLLGDQHLQHDVSASAAGIAVRGLPTMPDGQALLVNPDNIVVGIQRDMKVEVDKDITSGQYMLVLSVRFHACYAVRESVVRATGIEVPYATQTTVGNSARGLGGRMGDFAFGWQAQQAAAAQDPHPQGHVDFVDPYDALLDAFDVMEIKE